MKNKNINQKKDIADKLDQWSLGINSLPYRKLGATSRVIGYVKEDLNKNNIYKENYDLRQQLKQYQEAAKDCLSLIYCIGGPLNDNVLKYNKKQLLIFFKLVDILKG